VGTISNYFIRVETYEWGSNLVDNVLKKKAGRHEFRKHRRRIEECAQERERKRHNSPRQSKMKEGVRTRKSGERIRGWVKSNRKIFRKIYLETHREGSLAL